MKFTMGGATPKAKPVLAGGVDGDPDHDLDAFFAKSLQEGGNVKLPAELRPENVIAIADTREQLPLDLSPLHPELRHDRHWRAAYGFLCRTWLNAADGPRSPLPWNSRPLGTVESQGELLEQTEVGP